MTSREVLLHWRTAPIPSEPEAAREEASGSASDAMLHVSLDQLQVLAVTRAEQLP